MNRKKESSLVRALEVMGIVAFIGACGLVVYAQNQYNARRTTQTYVGLGVSSNEVERAVNYRSQVNSNLD